MATLYTPSAGNTPQGQGLDQYQSALGQIKGSIPQPQQVEQSFQTLKGQSNTQAPMADAQKMVDMYLHDQNLSQKYQSQTPAVLGASSPTDLPVQLTPDNINAPFSGLQDPLAAYQAGANEFKGVTDTIRSLYDLVGKNFDILGEQSGQQARMYERNLDAKLKATDKIDALLKFVISERNNLTIENSKLQAAQLRDTKRLTAQQSLNLQKELNERDYKLGEINSVIEMLNDETKNIRTGTGYDYWYNAANVPGLNNMISDDERSFYNSVSYLGSDAMFTIGGKALTATEKQELVPLIPRLTHSKKTNINNLYKLQNKINAKYSDIPGTEASVQLANPQTGELYSYDNISDPDYQSDLEQGFIPQ